jgi:hypothetical protein
MSRGSHASIDQERVVRQLTYEGHGAAQIYRELEIRGLLDYPNPSLVKRTVERTIQRLKPLDLSGPWSLVDARPEDARLVLDVLQYTFDWTGGRVWLTKDLAKWVAHVRAASPSISLVWTYAFALAYRALGEQEDGRHLDLALASTPWVVDKWSFEQWMRLIDAGPSPEKIDKLLYIGGYETDSKGELVHFRWLPPFEPAITIRDVDLVKFVVSGPPGHREQRWLSGASGIEKETATGEFAPLAAPMTGLTGAPVDGSGDIETGVIRLRVEKLTAK